MIEVIINLCRLTLFSLIMYHANMSIKEKNLSYNKVKKIWLLYIAFTIVQACLIIYYYVSGLYLSFIVECVAEIIFTGCLEGLTQIYKRVLIDYVKSLEKELNYLRKISKLL